MQPALEVKSRDDSREYRGSGGATYRSDGYLYLLAWGVADGQQQNVMRSVDLTNLCGQCEELVAL